MIGLVPTAREKEQKMAYDQIEDMFIQIMNATDKELADALRANAVLTNERDYTRGENDRLRKLHGDQATQIAALREALQRSLSWLSSYPGGCAEPVYEQARAALGDPVPNPLNPKDTSK